MRIAYFTNAAGIILCAMAIELHVEFWDRPQTVNDRAHGQDGNFEDRWIQNNDALTSAALQGGYSARTYAYTIFYSY